MRRCLCGIGLFIGAALAALPATALADMAAVPDADGFIQLTGQTERHLPLWVLIALRRSNSDDRRAVRVEEKDRIGSDWWGTDDHVIATLEVRINGEFVPLYRSAYADLGEVRVAQIVTAKNGFSLVIKGGELGTAYTARLHFRGGFLLGREVRHDEMGVEEKTQYFPLHTD